METADEAELIELVLAEPVDEGMAPEAARLEKGEQARTNGNKSGEEAHRTRSASR